MKSGAVYQADDNRVGAPVMCTPLVCLFTQDGEDIFTVKNTDGNASLTLPLPDAEEMPGAQDTDDEVFIPPPAGPVRFTLVTKDSYAVVAAASPEVDDLPDSVESDEEAQRVLKNVLFSFDMG